MPIFAPALLTKLLGSIEANNLAILCGAGLSIPQPSALLSAAKVAEACYDKWLATEALPVALRSNIDLLAGHFYQNGLFESVFIRALVPWDDLVGEPNAGHAAIADMLLSRAASACLTANFDPLIEQWAERHKVSMDGALDGTDATQFAGTSNPLLKFHGCLRRDKPRTLWTKGQLTDPTISQRVASCSNWMTLNLPHKDLLLVGFWTDWGYLNDVLANVISVGGVNSITVVDISPAADLQTKAPGLWAKLSGSGVPFEVVQGSGTVALDELRSAFSVVWARKYFRLGKSLFEAEGHVFSDALAEPVGWTSEDLYKLRQDAEGEPYHRAARTRAPAPGTSIGALAHLLLLDAGAARQGAWFEKDGMAIRVVQGAGQALETVRQRYNEPPTLPQSDVVVCAGAVEFNTPGNVIPSGHGASIVRPARGGNARWVTLDRSRQELGF